MKLARFLLVVLAAMAYVLPSARSAEATKLDAADRQHLLAAKDAAPLRKMSEIPAEVVKVCKGLGGYGDFQLADPGEPFQVTDVITEKHLLGRRLIWAVSLPGYVVIHYESGGIAHFFDVVVVAVDASKKAHVLWLAETKPLKSFAEFQEGLSSGKLDFAPR